MFKEITTNNKSCVLMKAIKNPKYGSKTVLTDSSWEYVALFLTRQSTPGSSDALFYWEQAHSFYLASQTLPDSASPLTSYYCILNATKALLRFKNVESSKLNNHGISSVRTDSDNTNLKEAKTAIKGAGVLPELTRYFDCQLQPQHYSIFALLYNIPCVHRAYCITFRKPEIFVPISHPVFVKKDSSKEAWLKFRIDGSYANAKSLKHVPNKFEHDIGISSEYIMRMKKRFNWDIHDSIENRRQKLSKYHTKTRKYIYYIYGESRLWYIKKDISDNSDLALVPSSVLIFCVFHWISELVRYDPKLFQKYMKSKQNWLINEFVKNGLNQFIDELSCEITGEDIMCTGYRK